MKTKIKVNGMRRWGNVLLSRRLGSGWILIEIGRLVRDQRQPKLLWVMRHQRVETSHETTFESPNLQHITR